MQIKRRKKQGFYTRLKDIKCDCGQPATRQVQIAQFGATGKNIKNVLPLCEPATRC